MTLADLGGFAGRAVSGHRLRSLLSLTGVAIGVAAVILLTALGEGARRYVVEQFASIGTNIVIVIPGRTETTGGAVPGVIGVPNDLTLDDARAVERSVLEVREVAPITVATETVSRAQRSRQVAVIGTSPAYLEVRELDVGRGSFLPEDDLDRGAPVVVLGRTVARELFPGGEDPIGQIVRVGSWRMRVIGTMGPVGQQLGVDLDEVVMVPVATGMKMFNRTGLFRMLIQIGAHTDLESARERIRSVLAERHGEEDFTVLTEDAVVSTFDAILSALTIALAAIAAVSLTVAGIGIMNVMLVSVSERTSEIGLMRAVGVAPGQVVAVFLAEAIVLSMAGGIVGLLAGFGAVRLLVQIFPALPAAPPLWAVLSALLVSVLVGAIFGLMPARRAARLDPVVALRS